MIVANQECPLTLALGEEQLAAVLHEAIAQQRVGILIVVGGPQYRVGSHRQFLLMARRFAEAGFPVLRFDVRGMGDSSGRPRTFVELDDDIRTAVDAVCEAYPEIERVCLWGLCDGASAALLYAAQDPRIGGLVLVNPWVHTTAIRSKALVRSYYAKRLFSGDFWKRALTGQVAVRRSVREAGSALQTAAGRGPELGADDYVSRMLMAMQRFDGQVLVILSGLDIVADEFRAWLASSSSARRAFFTANVEHWELREANHTFSSLEWRRAVEDRTLRWLDRF